MGDRGAALGVGVFVEVSALEGDSFGPLVVSSTLGDLMIPK